MASSRRVTSSRAVGGGASSRRDGYFDSWQDAAITQFEGQRLCAVSGPTGCGKSALEQARCADFPGKSVLFAPQTMIVDGLAKPLDLRRRADGRRIQWAPRLLLDGDHNVDRLCAFLESDAQNVTAVCTTPTVQGAFTRLRDSGNLRYMRRAQMLFDEIHLSDALSPNLTGEILNDLYCHGTAPILCSTATWCRTNLNEILPNHSAWTWFRYPMHQYLLSLRYLRRITIGFLIGSPEQALTEMLDDGLYPTLVHLARPNSRHESLPKAERLATLLRVCGPYRESYPFRIHRRGSARIISSDLVTEEDRDGVEGRKAAHMALLRTRPPHITFALGMARMGYDHPPLQRGLMIGASDSQIDRLQSLGRLLRDVEGKTFAEFSMVIPPLVDRSEAGRYLTDIVASLADLDWRIRPAKIDYDVRPEGVDVEDVVEDDIPNVDEATREILGTVIRRPPMTDDQLLDLATSVLRNQGVRDPSAQAAELLERQTRIARSINPADIPGVPLAHGLFGAMERLSVDLTAQRLLDIRRQTGADLELAVNEIREAVVAFYTQEGQWPTQRETRLVPGIPGETWLALHGAAKRHGTSLDAIVDVEREQVSRSRRRRTG